MNLGVHLESPQGSQSWSPVGACTSAFIPSCSSNVTLRATWKMVLWLSLEAFPRGFPTGLSLLPPWCELILGVKVEAVQGNLVHLECTETSGGSWNGGTTLEFLSAFLLRGPPLEMRWEPGEFFPKEAGKGSLRSSYGQETGLLWMWAEPSCFLSS